MGYKIVIITGTLKVFYSERLVSLLREVRQLSAFGFTIPPKIQKVATTAQKYYRHGVVLKQVVSFPNMGIGQWVLSIDIEGCNGSLNYNKSLVL